MAARISKFISLAAGRKRILAEAVLFLFAARLSMILLPLKRIIGKNAVAGKEVPDDRNALLLDIRWALQVSDRLAFWKNRCLVSCIAGSWMLGRRGISHRIHFGVKHNDEKKVIAHSWLIAGEIELVEKGGDYCEFVHV